MANADALRQQLIDGADSIMRAVVEDVHVGLVEAWDEVVHEHTGNPHLVDTWYQQQASDSPRVSWTFGFTAPQGEWLEFGVDPHPLGAGSPGDPGSVRHWISDAGEDVFRRYTGWEVAVTPRPWFNIRLNDLWPAVVGANQDAAGW